MWTLNEAKSVAGKISLLLQSGAADRSLGFEDEDLRSSPAGGPLL